MVVGVVALLAGSPAHGEARITPSTVDFGVQPQGQQSAPVEVELMNTGRNPFRVYRSEVNSGPDNADFLVVRDGCSGLDLAPQERCPLEVAFRPKAVGPTSQTVGILHPGLDATAPGCPIQYPVGGALIARRAHGLGS